MTSLKKDYVVDATLTAAGDGLWGVVKGTKFHVTKITVVVHEFDDCFFGEVTLTHHQASNIVGLPYTDKQIADEAIALLHSIDELWSLVKDMFWSEQGMQGMYSMNFDAAFYGKDLSIFKLVGFTE